MHINRFMFLHRRFNFTSNAASLATKVLVQQAIYTPIFNTYFFTMQSFLSGASFEQTLMRLQIALPTSIVNGWKVWSGVAIVSFMYIPPQFRTIVVAFPGMRMSRLDWSGVGPWVEEGRHPIPHFKKDNSPVRKRDWSMGLHWGLEPLQYLVPAEVLAQFRAMLLQGQDVHWEKSLVDIDYFPAGERVTAKFSDGSDVVGSIIVATDGPYSAVRYLLVSEEAAKVTPIDFASKSVYPSTLVSTLYSSDLSHAIHLPDWDPSTIPSRDFADIKVYVFMFKDLVKVKSFVAPWRRVIVCRGLSAVTKAGIPINNNTAKEILPCIDMTGGTLSFASKDFARGVTDASIAEAVELHMNCTKRTRGDRINPYLDASRAFHITFYEIIVHRFGSSNKEFWKTDPFYVRPGAPWFRRSAITTLVVTEDGYAKRNTFPRQWKSVLEIGQIQVGEVAIIKEAYSMLASRRLNLMDYIADLLREDFIDPEKYIKLIFDGDQLSTSKNTLEGIKRQIDDTVETVKGRRDGLFNASALSETRNTNRLSQNVKLLTYVSIFYLPLAFCAAVWAIPNIDMSNTKTAFSIAAVVFGMVNFVIVANVGNLSRIFISIYKVWRTRVVTQMKSDPDNLNQLGWNLENSWPERLSGPSMVDSTIPVHQVLSLDQISLSQKTNQTWRLSTLGRY
ncbi:uncharacterized protein N7458_001725 [Penicillium daleae]|uniref:Uncharacterized protein n=1 Tax=Penicillium daleae TaxID=63821 RepID=A0AAD6CD89_9EURO|nr:uncharacterized protein N7458_001725 [Penicillium daleae]KAJ5460173.1 hypothetical protein N7458_001725 [Penicillium daleae]